MDEIVQAAMAKWPKVPACYGWLALDRRGRWRMRDEQAQQEKLPGIVLEHPGLLAFIARNYSHNERGEWFFQNGQQRVYVDLEATPLIYFWNQNTCHDHLQRRADPVQAVFMDEAGHLYFRTALGFGLLCDRDLQRVEHLLEPITSSPTTTCWHFHAPHVPQPLVVEMVRAAELPQRFSYVMQPLAHNASLDKNLSKRND
jgi:hypothetical protein